MEPACSSGLLIHVNKQSVDAKGMSCNQPLAIESYTPQPASH